MKIFLLAFVLLMTLFCFSAVVSAQPDERTPHVQENILRVAPDDSAAFVLMVKPVGGPPTVTVLSRQGEWEEVRLYYRFKYNGSTAPDVCMMSLFERTFTGFRKIAQ